MTQGVNLSVSDMYMLINRSKEYQLCLIVNFKCEYFLHYAPLITFSKSAYIMVNIISNKLLSGRKVAILFWRQY